ncbi:MAG: bifunctional glutamate N-acetyltransferase/amino-acid acetyltransferase ArgJ [Acidobacteriota bacterium]|jgi:glutamate N-acetyltransferase/amino-acid N-acetyltransferase|nr:bifunctional glutamate N-acetyltransferase/amino-acid acetyltransferase ArgJ [Acidobacteriota bacterium]
MTNPKSSQSPKSSKSTKTQSAAATGWSPIEGGVTAPEGYLAAGVAAGVKAKGLDLAVVFSSQPASAAGVFTQNRVKAAPVLLSRDNLKLSRGRARAILINSGCANACTGERGKKDSLLSTQTLASRLNVDAEQVLVASTGAIGYFLPMPKLLKGIASAASALNSKGGLAAAHAIMTTDTCEKIVAFEGKIDGKTVRIGGMAKGSGMIHPNMATMLGIITTDVKIAPRELQKILRRVSERTFNCLTVDGDTSTNDTVFVLANGASGAVAADSRSLLAFEKGLNLVCEALVKAIARDGEGATKFVEIVVKRATDFESARTVAKAIAHSPLVKTALFGQELNWGRILCAVGYSKIPFDPDEVTLSLNGIPIFRKGAPVSTTRDKAEKAIQEHDLKIEVDLAEGKECATVWTCDLSHEYVNINASYIS